MTRDDSPIDDLLRSHFAGELDRQRGRCERAFLQQVTGPMQRRLDAGVPSRRIIPWRNYSAVGLAMAACMAVGFVLPSVLTRTENPTVATGVNDINRPLGPSVAGSVVSSPEQTTVLDNYDAGPLIIDGRPQGRRIRQQKLERIIFTDPATNLQYECFVPSEHDVVVPAVRQ